VACHREHVGLHLYLRVFLDSQRNRLPSVALMLCSRPAQVQLFGEVATDEVFGFDLPERWRFVFADVLCILTAGMKMTA